MARLISTCIVMALWVSSAIPPACAEKGPAYQRTRDITFANSSQSTYGFHQGYGGYPGIGVPFGYPGFASQVYAGTWYERPYPYHFDYYRMQYNSQPVHQFAPDCPCLVSPIE